MPATGKIITDVRNGHILTFRENPYHVYTLDGLKIPGGTDVKKAYPPSRQLIRYYIKQGLEEFDSGRKLNKASDIGTYMHDYCYAKRMNKPEEIERLEKEVSGHNDEIKIRKRFAEVDLWLPTIQNQEVIAAEQIVARVCDFHKEHPGVLNEKCFCYGGKFDVLVRVNGKIRIQDYKSSRGHFEDQFLQEGGYAIAIEEWLGFKVDELETIRFNDNTEKPASFCIDNPSDVEEFKEEFLILRQSRRFQRKWEKFFSDKYEKENPWIKKKK